MGLPHKLTQKLEWTRPKRVGPTTAFAMTGPGRNFCWKVLVQGLHAGRMAQLITLDANVPEISFAELLQLGSDAAIAFEPQLPHQGMSR